MCYFVANVQSEDGRKYALFVTDDGVHIVRKMREGSASQMMTPQEAISRAMKFSIPSYRMRHDPVDIEREISYL